jgi:hypothetical protein
LRIFLPVLFPIRQRRHGDFRVFRIRPMHRLGVVPQRLLREPLLQLPFQPRAIRPVGNLRETLLSKNLARSVPRPRSDFQPD